MSVFRNATVYKQDIRNNPLNEKADCCVYLAAVSNDPMETIPTTFEINRDHAIETAKRARGLGFKKFIFASSCSVYGGSGDEPRNTIIQLTH